MFLWFENHSVFTLKPSVISYLNGTGGSNNSKRVQAAILAKNKNEGSDAAAGGSQPATNSQSMSLMQANSQRALGADAQAAASGLVATSNIASSGQSSTS